MKTTTALAALLASLPLLAGCGAARPPTAQMPEMQRSAAPAAPPVLERSFYAKDASGSVTEAELQHILGAPIDLELPARVGVVPLADAFDPKGPVSIAVRGTASRDLARALLGHANFSQVSDVSTELPNAGGIEGLRVIAARYRLRYLLLYSERFEDATHLNGWALTYPTIVGMFLTPGVTVESHGLAQADLLDVRTGTILFSVVEPIEVKDQAWMVGAAREHRDEQARAASKAAKRLAARVTEQTTALVAFADEAARGRDDARTHILPAPIAATRAERVGDASTRAP